MPSVSIIMPCYQEKDFIARCLDSLVDSSYPSDKLEILVLDGGSDDGTREVISDYSKKHPNIFLRDNTGRYPPFAMNRGIRDAKGEIIIRCDAHAVYDREYIKKLAVLLSRDRTLGNAGGVWINVPSSESLRARSIAHALGHLFCVGPSRYRTGVKSPAYVDTVPFGAWRREIFDEVGFFNEDFLRAQDIEFNTRLLKAGYRILLDPGIKSYYYPRDSFAKLFKMMFQYGYWKNFVNKRLKTVSSTRQLFPPAFVLYLLSLPFLAFVSAVFFLPLALYLLLTLFSSFRVAREDKSSKIILPAAFTFFVSHFGYGAGYLKGLWDFFIRRKDKPPRSYAGVTR